MKKLFGTYLTVISMGLGIFLSGCIGTDFQDDPIVGEMLVLNQEQVALKPNEQFQITPIYFDKFGLEKTANYSYLSTVPAIASVDNKGLIIGKSSGSAIIQVQVENRVSASMQVNIVSDPTSVALVEITSPTNSLSPGQQAQLTIKIKTVEGKEITGIPVEWFSENESLASVDGTGKVTGKSNGRVAFHAKVNSIKSNSVEIDVVSNQVSGTFVPAGGYRASGTATISKENNKLILRLSNNFETSFALGTYIYLANTTSGSQVRSSGIEISEIKTNGEATFDLTAKYPSLGILDFKYVIIYCKPAGVTFGFALMK